MKAKTIINIALGLVLLACLFHWREVWEWMNAKTWDELAGDIIGFALKWFYLAIFGWLAAQIPHYIKPWLKLARLNGRRKLRAVRRGNGQSVEAQARMPRMSKNEALVWMANQVAKINSTPTQKRVARDNDIYLKF